MGIGQWGLLEPSYENQPTVTTQKYLDFGELQGVGTGSSTNETSKNFKIFG